MYSLLKIKINKNTQWKPTCQPRWTDKSEDGLLQARVSKVSSERSPQGQPEGQEEGVWTTWPSWTVTQGLPVTHTIRGDHKRECTWKWLEQKKMTLQNAHTRKKIECRRNTGGAWRAAGKADASPHLGSGLWVWEQALCPAVSWPVSQWAMLPRGA